MKMSSWNSSMEHVFSILTTILTDQGNSQQYYQKISQYEEPTGKTREREGPEKECNTNCSRSISL